MSGPSADRGLTGFDLELTARCNLDCRHCDIRLPKKDKAARRRELSAREIAAIASEAAALGAVRCRLTGGEPLLRKDFVEVYRALLGKGLRPSLFTNVTLLTDEHIRLFKKFPPLAIEVTLSGVSRETYERVTRTPGSYDAFLRGLGRLRRAGLPVRLVAVVLRSNKHEIPDMREFCRAWTTDDYRFDPHLGLRFDRDAERNVLIRAERLDGREIARLERLDPQRFADPRAGCGEAPAAADDAPDRRRIFRCGAGRRSFVIGPDGRLRVCRPLVDPDFLFDLRTGRLAEAWNRFLPRVLARTTGRPVFLEKCGPCALAAFCLWCPGRAYLETGEVDSPVEAFCRAAEERGQAPERD